MHQYLNKWIHVGMNEKSNNKFVFEELFKILHIRNWSNLQHMCEINIISNHVCVAEATRSGHSRKVSLIISVPSDNTSDALEGIIDVSVHAERVACLCYSRVVGLKTHINSYSYYIMYSRTGFTTKQPTTNVTWLVHIYLLTYNIYQTDQIQRQLNKMSWNGSCLGASILVFDLLYCTLIGW